MYNNFLLIIYFKFNTKLAKFKHTCQIFKPDFLGNETL